MAGSSFAVGAAFVSRWTPAAKQGTSLGIYGLGTMGQSLAVFAGPVIASRLGWEAVFTGTSALLLAWAAVYFGLARNPVHAFRPATVADMVPRALAAREAYVDVVAAMDERPRSRAVPLRMLGDRPAGGSPLEYDPFAEVKV